jgi:outer membrane protein assembly factor BamB
MMDLIRRKAAWWRAAAIVPAALAGSVLSMMPATALHADDWPAYRGDLQHSGVSSEVVQPPLSLLWRYSAGAEPGNTSSPVVVGDTVYYSTRLQSDGGGAIFALDPRTGALRWHTQELSGQNFFTSTPLVQDGKLYVGASDGRLYVYDAHTGSDVVQFNAGRTVDSSPVISDGVLYFGANDGVLRAIDPTTGGSAWRQVVSVGDAINSSPILAGSLIFFTSSDDTIYAVNIATGTIKWSNRLPDRFGPNAAVFADNTLYVPSGAQLNAIQPNSGNFRWQIAFPSELLFAPVAADGVVYVLSDDKQLYAIRSNGRSDVWPKPAQIGYTASASPTISGDAIYIPTTRGILLALSREDGRVLWQYRIPSVRVDRYTGAAAAAIVSAPVAISNKAVYVTADDGTLSAFRPDAIDTTAPLPAALYPPAGASVNGSPGLIVAANIQDEGSGIDPKSVKLTLDGKGLDATYDAPSDLVFYKTRATGKIIDPPLSDGRHTVTVTAADYKGNVLAHTWSFLVDNTLPQIVVPTNNTGQGGRGGGPGGGYPGGGPGGGYPGGGPAGGYRGGR